MNSPPDPFSLEKELLTVVWKLHAVAKELHAVLRLRRG